MELVRFDTQLMENAEIAGVAYQQGTLAGYEVREYLLEKGGRRCASCGAAGVPIQVEHLIPRAKGGSNRVSNLTLAHGGGIDSGHSSPTLPHRPTGRWLCLQHTNAERNSTKIG
jgi:hypothetical protein